MTGFQDVVKELDIVKAELPVESDRFVEVFQVIDSDWSRCDGALIDFPRSLSS